MFKTWKKWIVILLLLAALTGCSWQDVKKYLDKADWEPSDRTIGIVDLIIR